MQIKTFAQRCAFVVTGAASSMGISGCNSHQAARVVDKTAQEVLSTSEYYGKKMLSSGVVAHFHNNYSPVDTFVVSKDMSKNITDSITNRIVNNFAKGGERIGLNYEGKPFLVYNQYKAPGVRVAEQFSEGGRLEKVTVYDNKTPGSSSTFIYKDNNKLNENYVEHENNMLKDIHMGDYVFSSNGRLVSPK